MAEQESTTSADANWQAFMEGAAASRLTPELIRELGRGAALLLRVAQTSPDPDARGAERWLSTVGRTVGLIGAALEDVQ